MKYWLTRLIFCCILLLSTASYAQSQSCTSSSGSNGITNGITKTNTALKLSPSKLADSISTIPVGIQFEIICVSQDTNPKNDYSTNHFEELWYKVRLSSGIEGWLSFKDVDSIVVTATNLVDSPLSTLAESSTQQVSPSVTTTSEPLLNTETTTPIPTLTSEAFKSQPTIPIQITITVPLLTSTAEKLLSPSPESTKEAVLIRKTISPQATQDLYPSKETPNFSSISWFIVIILAIFAIFILSFYMLKIMRPQIKQNPNINPQPVSRKKIDHVTEAKSKQQNIKQPDKAPNNRININNLAKGEKIKTGLSEPYSFSYPQKGEDVLKQEYIIGKYPTIILADGNTNAIIDGIEISGGGQNAAKEACDLVLKYLKTAIKPDMSLVDIGELIDTSFHLVNKKLKDNNQNLINNHGAYPPGATTLIIAILFTLQNSSTSYWCYGYLGDGYLALGSPSRESGGYIGWTNLLTAHKDSSGSTISLPNSSSDFKPIVAFTKHQPGDFVVIATDGIDSIRSRIMKKLKIQLVDYIWMYSDKSVFPPILPDLKNDENVLDKYTLEDVLSDDTTLGVIWTNE